eukprot:g78073.t1
MEQNRNRTGTERNRTGTGTEGLASFVTHMGSQPSGMIVECVETGKRYKTSKHAAHAIGVSVVSMDDALNTGIECGGYRWRTRPRDPNAPKWPGEERSY